MSKSVVASDREKAREETRTVSHMNQVFNTFTFWNGDEYTGEFSALKDKQKIAMEGKGVYKTSDNQIYEGIWEDDSLKKAVKVVFQDKSEFSGDLEDMVIQGHGKYRFKEDVEIEGEFVGNCLTGSVYLKDPNQHLWRGDVGDDSFVWFYPLHSFWQAVLSSSARTSSFMKKPKRGRETIIVFRNDDSKL